MSKAESAPETTATIKAEYVLVDELECDALFANPIEISMKKEALTEYCTKFVEEYFAQSRPVRTVKSPVKYDASVYTSPVRPRGRTEVDVETAGISSLKETLEKEDKKGDQTPVRKTDKEAQLSPLRVRSKSPEPGYKTPPRTPSTRRQSAKVQSAVEPIRSLAEEERHGSLTPSKKAVSNSAKKSLTPLKTDAVLSSPKRGVKVN